MEQSQDRIDFGLSWLVIDFNFEVVLILVGIIPDCKTCIEINMWRGPPVIDFLDEFLTFLVVFVQS